METQASFVRPIHIFYYSDHADRKYVDQLERHLRSLQRSGRVETWSDYKMLPGTNAAEEINKHIVEADIILILISADLLDSSTYEYTIAQIFSRYQQGARIIPVLVRPTAGWQDGFYGALQPLPPNGRYISIWPNLDQGISEVARGIIQVVENLQTTLADEISWITKGDQLRQAGIFEQAIAAYDMAIQRDPNDLQAYLGRGQAYQSLEARQQALQDFDKALALDPKNSTIYVVRGQTYQSLKAIPQALQDFDQALALDPNNPTIYVVRGNLLREMNSLTEAISSYQAAIRLDGNNIPALMGLGTTLSLVEINGIGALNVYEYILNIKPLNTEIAYHIYLSEGELFQRLQHVEQAIAAYEKAQAINPKQVDTYLALGNLFFQKGRFLDALRVFTQAAQINPRNIAAHQGNLNTYLKLERLKEASNCIDILISLDTNNGDFYSIKSQILSRLGDTDNARSAYAQAIGLGISPSDLHPLFRQTTQENGEADTTDIFSLDAASSETEAGLQSIETRTKLIHQFLQQAGFDLMPTASGVGFMATTKRGLWQDHFQRGLYVRTLLNTTLDQRTVNAIYEEARRDCNHALIIVNQQPEFGGWAQMNILRMEPGHKCFICLPIDEALIIKGLTTNKALMTLNNYIDNNMGHGFNPYDDHQAVSGLRFFGRQHLTEQLLAGLSQHQNLGLFGIQKMGKSSLLYDLEKHADFPLAYVYLNADDDLSRIYSRITSAWATHGRTRLPHFSWENPLANISQPGTTDFDKAVNNLLEYLLETGEMKPLLGILFDEIEHIVPKEGEKNKLQLYIHLMDKLRGLQQETGGLALLVAGVQPSVGRTNYFWGTQKNPLYQLLIERFLPPMEQEECKNMILSLGQQINLSYSPEALKAILELSGAHPYLARRLCSQIYKQTNQSRVVNASLVEEVAQDFIRAPATASYFGSFNDQSLWEELGKAEPWGEQVGQANQQLLLKLAAVEHDLSEAELTTSQDGQPSPANSAAFYALKERCIISSPTDNGYYHITMGLFEDWLRFNNPIHA